METEYWIYFDYGMHHVWIQVTKQSFFNLIDDMSTEFEIHRREAQEINKFCKINTVHYFFYNYYGDFQEIGRIENFDESLG